MVAALPAAGSSAAMGYHDRPIGRRAENMIKVGIVGGTGYTGVELLRLLVGHPQVELVAITSRQEAGRRVAELFPRLEERRTQAAGSLSGGEQQRVAFCRALANRPSVLLADEPTGNLDPGTSDQVFEVLMELVRSSGLAALIATHNLDLAARMDRMLRLEQGKLLQIS